MRTNHARHPLPYRWLFAVTALSVATACGNEIDADLGAGDAAALDDATSSLTTNNLLTNGSFETGIAPWYLNINNGAGTLVADTTTRAAGAASAKLSVTQSLANIWDLAVVQPGLAVTSGGQYTASFYAKANSSSRQVTVQVGQGYSPWSAYSTQTFSLSKRWRRYSFTFTQPTSDSSAQVVFASGQSTGAMWLDAVSLTRELPASPVVSLTVQGAPNLPLNGTTTLVTVGYVSGTPVRVDLSRDGQPVFASYPADSFFTLAADGKSLTGNWCISSACWSNVPGAHQLDVLATYADGATATASVALNVADSTTPGPDPTPAGFPPDGTLGFTAVASMPMPGYLQTVTDPTFGNLVKRISDQSAFGTSSRYLGHEYSKVQVWNADGSLIMLGGNLMQDAWDTGYLLDGSTGQYLRTVHPGAGNHSFRWSNVNPDNAYEVPWAGNCNSTNQIVVWHPKSDTLTVLHTFTQYDSYANTGGCPNMSFGQEEGNFSNDDSLGVVIGWSTAHNSWGMTTFNVANAASATPSITERATYWFGAAGGNSDIYGGGINWNNVGATPKGEGVVVEWNGGGVGLHQGIEWYDPDLTTVKHVSNTKGYHFDMGLDANGNEMLVTDCGDCGVPGAFIAGYPMGSSGPSPGVILLDTTPYPALNHISCRNQYGRPGWCYVSDYQNNTSNYSVGYEQIYALKLDGSQTVEVFGVDHGSYSTSQWSNAYTAKAVPSRDGKRVVFGSDWGAGTSSPSYEYMAWWP